MHQKCTYGSVGASGGQLPEATWPFYFTGNGSPLRNEPPHLLRTAKGQVYHRSTRTRMADGS